MKNPKQLQLILSSIFMVLASLTGYGQQEFTVGNIKYKITSTTEVEIVDYTGTGGTVTIPSTVDNGLNTYTVTAIGDNAFYDDQLSSVIIPEGVTHIGIRAFMNNDINNVVIPTTVIDIGHTAFWNNPISSLDIPEGITDIGNNTFGRNNLASVTIPASVTSIGSHAFITHPDSPSEMTKLTMLGRTPPTLQDNSFTIRGAIRVIVPDDAAAVAAYEARNTSDWNGFQSFATNDQIGVGVQFIDGDLQYVITSTSPDKEVMVIGLTDNTTAEVTIPQTVNHDGTDYKVTSIGEEAFFLFRPETQKKGPLTKVTFDLPSNVTSIRKDAFWNNQLTSIVIPESVTSLGQRAFGDNNNLVEVNIPSGVTRIEKWTFAQCDLRELTIPANVGHIDQQAFFRNQNLPKVTVERNPPTTLGENVFQDVGYNLDHLGGVDLVVPFGTIQAYKDAGWMLPEFRTITSGITTLNGVKYGIIDSRNEATLVDHVNPGHHLVIPSEVDIDGNTYPVTAVGDGAFVSETYALQTVIIPESVKKIGFQAFYVRKIDWIMMLSDDPPALDSAAFEYPYRNDIDLIVPELKERVYKNAGWTRFREVFSLNGRIFRGDDFVWDVRSVLPNEVSLLAYRGPRVDTMKIPSEVDYLPNSDLDKTYTVTSIEKEAFWNDQFTSVAIPDAVTYIGEYAFQNKQLANVDIPENVTRIKRAAFRGNQLTSVKIPDSMTDIGEYAFAQNQLTSVTTPVNVKRIRSSTYASNQLTEVTISDSVTNIDVFAFEDNPNLRLVTVKPIEPPSLNEHAFSNAYRDQIDLVVPMSDTSIQVYLDHGWDGFRSISFGIFTVDDIRYGITSRTEVMVVDYTGTDTAVTIPETVHNDQDNYTYTVTAIGEGAFQNKELTNIEIPTSVTSIGQMAFMDNQLTEVAIPGSMESIGFHAFYNNPDLGLVTAGAKTPALDATAFANANRHQIDLLVPTGKRQDYLDNGWNGFRSVREGIGLSIDAPAETVNLSPFTVTFQFDLEVTGFTIDDINLGNNATANHFTGSGSIYTVEVTPTSCNGVITIDVPANGSDMPNFTSLQATATVIVEEDPDYLVANARDIIVQLNADGRAAILPEDVDNGSAYGCGGTPELSLDIATFDCSHVGTPVTVTLTANQGTESATTTATVTVEEYLGNLVAIAKDITVQLDAGGQVSITPEDVNNSSSYGCDSTPNLSLDKDTFTCDDVGTPVTVTLTVNQGTESATTTATVTVEEYLGNLTANAKDITVQLDAGGQVSITPEDVNNSSSYGCDSTPNLSLDKDTFTCDDVGTPITVTLTANQGTESATTTATVTVEEYLDNLTANAKDITVQLDASGQVTISPEDVDDGSSYGCGSTPELSLDIATFDCSHVGTPVTVTLTATQGNQTATATTQVTVEANGNCGSVTFTIAPIADVTLQENSVYTSVTPVLSGDDPIGTVTWTLGGTDAEDFSIDGSTGVVTMIARDFEAPVDANADNVYEVSITATDSENNSSGETSWTVTVQDDPFETPSQGSLSPMIPTAFTPNGDGANDTWIIDHLDEDASITIYDRHGTILFSSDAGYTRPWDGTHRGSRLPAGAYLYMIQNGPHKYTGTVTILL